MQPCWYWSQDPRDNTKPDQPPNSSSLARIGAGSVVKGGIAVAVKLAARAKGLSEAEFRAAFGTEEQCRAALEKPRWSRGFACPACGHGGHAWLAGRGLYQCNRCKRQVSLTAGTIFHATIDSKAANPVPQGREPTAREGCRSR